MRGTGWISGLVETLDRHHASAAHVAAARERAGTRPPDGGVAREPFQLDQFRRQSCVLEWGARATHAFTGIVASSQVGFWAARIGDAHGGPLTNVGVTMEQGMRALEKHGLCPLDVYDPGADYDPLATPPELARDAAQTCNLDVVPIYATGKDAVLALVDALSQGLPCGIALRADEGYRKPRDGRVGPESGPGELHFVYPYRYRLEGDGYWFKDPGSWGSDFGPVWLHESRIANAYFRCFARGVS